MDELVNKIKKLIANLPMPMVFKALITSYFKKNNISQVSKISKELQDC